MPELSFAPALSLLTAFTRLSPAQPIRTFIRSTGSKLRPTRLIAFRPAISRAQDEMLASGRAKTHQLAQIVYEKHRGSVPTVVIGGFVPDATEQVFLMRGFLRKHGSIYYINYPRQGFSMDLLLAQLDDLVEELAVFHGQKPTIFSVSFGAGIAMEWLKRARTAGRTIDLQGLILISPVACVEDLLNPAEAKPSTLLGRAIKPFMSQEGCLDEKSFEKCRAIFTKMFEAGAQNKDSIGSLLTRRELVQLRAAVLSTIQSLDATGASERVHALKQFTAPQSCYLDRLLPLSHAPTLILYSEKESSVITDQSPSRSALESARHSYFPSSDYHVITNRHGTPVQHASLIFHCFNFLPVISSFYQQLKTRRAYMPV